MKQTTTTTTSHHKKIRTRRFLFDMTFVLLAITDLSEGRIGTFRTKHQGTKLDMSSPELLRDQLQLVDSYGQSITTTSYYKLKDGYKDGSSSNVATPSTTTASKQQQATDVAELAACFRHALVAANQNHEDIHVGNLLSASERLEVAMRKIGFSQSANDIHGNVEKIRTVYNQVPPSQRNSMPGLLRYEMNSGIVVKGAKKFPEKSAAMGFLWLGRSLNYQHDMFSHMLDHDTEPFEAARHAYDRDLKPHLSWPLQKLCQAAMTSLKPKRQKEMLAQIGGFQEECYGNREDQATKRDLRQMMDSLKPMLYRWKQVFSELELGSI